MVYFNYVQLLYVKWLKEKDYSETDVQDEEEIANNEKWR